MRELNQCRRGNITAGLKRWLTIFLLTAGVLSSAASANAACAPGTPQLIIYHAGSVNVAFSAVESLFTQQTGICVTDASYGSVDAARRITTAKNLATFSPALISKLLTRC
jgi:ABC-type molybdate transport system substrate-binding protein